MSALFGPGGEASLYRYALHRDVSRAPLELPFDPPRRTCLFLMLNPSTATATLDDPTIRRCIAFTRAWGFTDLQVCNLFAFRATNPDELSAVTVDPIGPDNNAAIVRIAALAERIVCAWGVKGKHLARGQAVRKLLADRDLWALRLTKEGHPEHPLYMPSAIQPFVWKPKEQR